MDQLRAALGVAAAVAAGGLLAACGGHAPEAGTLHASSAAKLSFGVPVGVGRYLTLAQVAVTFTAGRGIVLESVTPIGLTGSGSYLGAALLGPPHVGFGEDISSHFPHLYSDPPFARLPYTPQASRGSLAVALGFTFRHAGTTSFTGVALRYREHGAEFVVTLPLGARMCVPAPRWSGRCGPPDMAQIPEAAVRRA